MLLNLHVKNLAIIEETEVEFTEGLNILSGETGAGKSIIIDSINLALGEKAPKEMIRQEEKPALVELVFQVNDPKQVQQLEEMGIELEEDGMIILSRKISKGRSIAKINSETVAISKMKEAAGILIDIHGQHEHQSLLHKKKHLEILDDYAKANLADLKQQMKEAYQTYASLKEELHAQDIDSEQQKRELSFLEYELNEIEAAQLKKGEDETLETEYRRLVNGKKIMEALQTAYMQTGSDGGGASDQTGRALRELIAVSEYDERAAGLTEQLREIDDLLSDFNRDLSDYLSDNDFDDETFAQVEERLDLINHLKDKYGDTIEKILNAAKEKQERMEKLQNYDLYLQQLKEKFMSSEKKVLDLAKKVSEIRKKAAKELVKEVKSALQDLNFLDVQFDMHFEPLKQVTANGMDDAEFLISTNPGEPMRGLGKVASGGELSRIMLAIKSVLAKNDQIETLIFDEIDTGISGRTAQAVSEKMNVIGRNHQVICITHLPQIAAMADSHFLIEKTVENHATASHIALLSEEESVRELARMLGGVKITDTVLESAREMKQLAQQKK
ncbi:MAG: DNA repair protein RecN [Lachnospiraceae bacterium]